MAKKKVVEKKEYTITVTDYDDGTQIMDRTCDGFNALELLGMLHGACMDIQDQIHGRSEKPTVINKKVVVRK